MNNPEATGDHHVQGHTGVIDYTNMEMQIACEAGKVFVDTETDIHVENARRLFGVKEVTPELRHKAKEAMFCWHYGGWPPKMVK